MADIVIETERLVLRKPEEGDAALQYRLLNSPEVMARLGGPKELHEIEAKHAASLSSFASHGHGFMMIIEKSSGELVGHCGLKRVDNPRARNIGDYEIGWLVRQDRWRRGYGFEAVQAVIGWAFTRHQAPHLVALTSQLNRPSWMLMEKLGMERAEHLDFCDPDYPPQDNPTIVYKLTRAKWEHKP